MARIEFVQGDITEQRVDAVVNAANPELAPGAGVDGAIRRAGGPEITAETLRIGPCPVGDAVATTAGELPARHVIHAVGPRWRGGGESEEELLGSAYRRAIDVAAEIGCRTIALPAISTGIYGYPPDRAATVALTAVRDALAAHPEIELVRFVLFSPELLETFERVCRG